MPKIYIGTGTLKQLYISMPKAKKIYKDVPMIWQSAIPIARPTSAQLNPSATYSGSSISNGFSMNGVEFVSGTASGTNAGTYVAYYRPDEEHIWSDTEDRAQVAVTLTVNAKSISGATIALDGSKTYNGSSQAQGVASVTIDGLSATYSVSGNTGTNAGSYTLTCTGTGNFTGSQSKSWSIAKATGSASGGYNASPTYNGTEQNLIAGCTGTGTIEYSTDQSYWYTETPSATNASSYTIYYRARESANYTLSAAQSVWCNLNKATGSAWSVSNASPTYNGGGQYICTEGGGTGTLYYSVDNANWSTTRPSATHPNAWYVYYFAAESANYTQSQTYSVWCNLNKATGSCWGGTNASPTYNGSWQWVITGATGTGSIRYSVDCVTWYESLGWTGAGGNTVYYKALESTDYTESGVASVWCNMNARALDTFTINGDWSWYTGGTITVTPATVSGGGMSATYSQSGTWSAVNGGGYTAYVTGTGNFTGTLSYTWYIQYVWARYYVSNYYADSSTPYTLGSWSGQYLFASQAGSNSWAYAGSSISFNSSNGVYTGYVNSYGGYTQLGSGNTWGTVIQTKTSSSPITFSNYVYSGSSAQIKIWYDDGLVKNYSSDSTTVYYHSAVYTSGKGSHIDYVGSTYSGSYPYDGIQSGYWYTHTW